METEIMKIAEKAISESIIKSLTDSYNNPLHKLCNEVLNNNHDKLFNLINKEFLSLIDSGIFIASLKDALNQKLARIIISKMGGELEKRLNDLRSNPELRAKITLGINNLIKELGETNNE